jgi:hypothetical protein
MHKTKLHTVTRYAAAASILVSLAFLVNFIPASVASGTSETGLPIEKIIAHRDFFIRLDGYDGNLLCDVNGEPGEGKIGLLLLEPSGFLKSLIFEQGTLRKIHEETSVPPKKLRAELALGAVLVSDARLIARNIAGLRAENTEKRPRRKAARHETPRREAMPQSLPDGFMPVPSGNRKGINTGKVLERLRRDVENNPDVAAMTSGEIIERFRSDIREKKVLP